jgi:hypothetical protein
MTPLKYVLIPAEYVIKCNGIFGSSNLEERYITSGKMLKINKSKTQDNRALNIYIYI